MSKHPESIWRLDATTDDLNERAAFLVERMGIRYEAMGPDHLTASMPVDERTIQPFGILHGGASAVLIETLGSVAGNLCLDPAAGRMVVGVEINVNHLRPATEGRVTGTVTPKHLGGTIQVWQADVVDDAGRPVSTGRLTLAVVKRRARVG